MIVTLLRRAVCTTSSPPGVVMLMLPVILRVQSGFSVVGTDQRRKVYLHQVASQLEMLQDSASHGIPFRGALRGRTLQRNYRGKGTSYVAPCDTSLGDARALNKSPTATSLTQLTRLGLSRRWDCLPERAKHY